MKKILSFLKDLYARHSKTQWFALLVALSPFIPGIEQLIEPLQNPEVKEALQTVLPILGGANMALRKVTKEPLETGLGLASWFLKKRKK